MEIVPDRLIILIEIGIASKVTKGSTEGVIETVSLMPRLHSLTD